MDKNKANILFSILMLIFCAFLYYLTFDFPEAPGDRLNPSFYPRLLMLVIAALCLIVLIQNIIDLLKKKPEDYNKLIKIENISLVAQVALSFITYVVLFNIIGFIVSTILYLVFTMRVIMEKNFWLSSLISVIFTITFYLIFRRIFRVPFPTLF